MKGSFYQTSAHAVEPEVAARFTKDCLIDMKSENIHEKLGLSSAKLSKA